MKMGKSNDSKNTDSPKTRERTVEVRLKTYLENRFWFLFYGFLLGLTVANLLGMV